MGSTEQAIEQPAAAAVPARVDWILVAAFVVVAMGGAWLVCIPLWAGKGLAEPNFRYIAAGMMYTPTLAAVIMTAIQRRRKQLPDLGLIPKRPQRRFFGFLILSTIWFPVLSLVALLLSWGFGTVTLDPSHLSGFRQVLEAQLTAAGKDPAALAKVNLQVLALSQIPNILVATLINSLLTFGEEFGWRGWLLPNLRPLGTWPALVISGVVWGAWHTPLILLGYNYQRRDALGPLLMIVFCVLLGIMLGWLRLVSGTIWPSVVGHAAINASVGTWAVILISANTKPNPATSTLLGWPGWLLMAVVIAVTTVLIVRRRAQTAPASPDTAAAA